jgi:phage terminase large subunit GpA-like protein
MGFLAPAEAVIAAAMARAMTPPPPPDITRWCVENVEFDDRSPFAGPFDPARFPFLTEIHEALNPEHPSREVTLMGSAQFGKTVSVIQPTLACWHETMALDSLVVHPTTTAAKEWVMNKWLPMRRQAPGLKALFGDGRSAGDNMDSLFNQETISRNGSLKVASAGSPADLTGTTRRLVILDDLSKYDMTDKGDPEQLAVSRASAFEDAKILRVSTPMVKGSCRIGRAFNRSDRRYFHVPCPHCGNMAPLTWENFRRNLDPERLHAAHFTCESCGAVILHADKERMVRAGRWVATHPGGDHPGFHLWRAYVPQRDWASIAIEYAQIMGWAGLTAGQAQDQESRAAAGAAETEQTFWNDVLGLPFEAATGGTDWEALRDRVENAEPGTVLPQGVVPACGVMLTAGVDCQADRIEVTICAYGSNYRRWVIEHRVIPHYIGDDEGRAALDALLKATWRTELGQRLPLDLLAIDQGNFTEDVKAWARRHGRDRVIRVKGSNSYSGPVLQPLRDRSAGGLKARLDRGGWLVNVSQIKADYFQWLSKADPTERGFVAFAAQLGDEYFRQVTAEVRVLRRGPSGVMVSRWEKVESTRRNECLDCLVYSEAAARKRGWTSMTEEQWARIADERGVAPPDAQKDLFDAPKAGPASLVTPAAESEKAPAAAGTRKDKKPASKVDAGSWLGPAKEGWF